MAIGLSDVRDVMDFLSAGVGIVGVCWPLGLALADALAFARFPAHRATPTSPWVFFDRRMKQRLLRWFWIWPLLVVACAGVVGLATWLEVRGRPPSATGTVSWFQQHPVRHATHLAAQTGAYTVSSMLLATAVVFALAFREWRPAVAIPVTVVVTTLVFAGIIASLGLPPPTAVQSTQRALVFHLDANLQARAHRSVLGTQYIVMALALSLVAGASMRRFYWLRRRKGLPVDEEAKEAGA